MKKSKSVTKKTTRARIRTKALDAGAESTPVSASSTSSISDLPDELRQLVRQAVALFGTVIRHELGEKAYTRIENVRQKMAAIRRSTPEKTAQELNTTFRTLEKLSRQERLDFARAYTLMFELINVCENAYRTQRLRERPAPELTKGSAESIVYVMTAHPTEARAPASIAVFQRIQALLIQSLVGHFESVEAELRAWFGIAWRAPIVRYRKPKVQDEAEHIYSILLRKENLSCLVDFGEGSVPLRIRSWVGGDKDGHPGVNAKTLKDSLQLSRTALYRYAKSQLNEVKSALALGGESVCLKRISEIERQMLSLRTLRTADGDRVAKFRKELGLFTEAYQKEIGGEPRALRRLCRLGEIFPGLVVPMELREDSGVLVSDPSGKTLAIGRMLSEISRLSGKADPRWYAQSMIISMTESVRHIEIAAGIVRKMVGDVRIPIVPLFEQKAALESAAPILKEMVKLPQIRESLKKYWDGKIEVMLGYSDSSKESGVLSSRLLVTRAMEEIDHLSHFAHFIPVFFHGSGGSIDRGGGSVRDQMAAWPKTARKNYKATIQGEMVERTFASPEITRSRLHQILLAAGEVPDPKTRPFLSAHSKSAKPVKSSEALLYFAEVTAGHYRETIASPRFLRMVERATPYRFLNVLKIGSRPSKRGGSLSVPSLRAIPWVLCWTQTRVLFQTWWGVGYAWEKLDTKGKKELAEEMKRNPLFATYVRALGFTLAKVELPIWEFYLGQAGLPESEVEFYRSEFRREFTATLKFLREITGEKDPLWFKPWLARSIELRASLIHPLNLLEILAQKDRDLPLLRLTVTGIASGMLTTG